MRLALLAFAVLAAVTPAAAKSLTASDVGVIFCIATLADDMAPVIAVATPELVAKLTANGDKPVRWQAQSDYANSCQPVGVSGTADSPEVILSYGFQDADRAGYAQSLVTKFVDGRLRLDDVKFPDNTTLSDALATK